jgi:hypothetical protein
VLCCPELRWLAGEQDKADFVRTTLPDFAAERLPHATIGRRFRVFPDDVAIGFEMSGRPNLLYLVTTPFEDEFRTFLRRYRDLLGALPQWTLRLLFVKVLESAVAGFEAAFRDELFVKTEGPLDLVATGRIVNHLLSETGRVECHVLGFTYKHLSTAGQPRSFRSNGG